jgi:hypothetical protein
MKIPTWKQKQDILYHPKSNVSSEKLIAYGQACIEQGYIQDAIEYFTHAGHTLGLSKIGQEAAQAGDYFTLKQCLSAMEPAQQASATQTCLTQAKALGKDRFAQQISHAQDTHTP